MECQERAKRKLSTSPRGRAGVRDEGKSSELIQFKQYSQRANTRSWVKVYHQLRRQIDMLWN